AQSFRALAAELAAVRDPAEIESISKEIANALDRAGADLAALRSAGSKSTQDLDAAHESFSRIREALIGPAGIASAVQTGIHRQKDAEAALAASRLSREDSKATGHLTLILWWTGLPLIAISITLVAAGIAGGLRLRSQIRSAEERDLENRNDALTAAEHASQSSAALHETAQFMIESNGAVSEGVDQIAAQTDAILSTVAEISQSASEALSVGDSAAELLQSA